jgi:hypothetical protein
VHAIEDATEVRDRVWRRRAVERTQAIARLLALRRSRSEPPSRPDKERARVLARGVSVSPGLVGARFVSERIG